MNDTTSIEAWLACARAVQVIASLLLAGVWVVDRFVVSGAAPAEMLRPAWRRIVEWITWAALTLVLISGVTWFFLVAAEMSGLPMREAWAAGAMHAVWSQTQFGKVCMIRSALFVIACALAAPSIRSAGARSIAAWIMLIISAAIAGSLAWAGHGMDACADGMHLPADIVHLLAAAAWPAGLLPFGAFLLAGRRSADSQRDFATINFVRRFSAMSLCAVAAIVASGIVNTCCMLKSPSDFWTSPYGRLLGIKIIVFIAMIVIGAQNLLVHRPRLLTIRAEQSTAAIQRNVFIETALTLIVLLIVGVLGTIAPPG